MNAIGLIFSVMSAAGQLAAGQAEKEEAARQKTRDAEYWPNPEEKKKQLDFSKGR